MLIGLRAQALFWQKLRSRFESIYLKNSIDINDIDLKEFRTLEPDFLMAKDGLEEALKELAEIYEAKRPEIREVELINVGRQMASGGLDFKGSKVSKAKM